MAKVMVVVAHPDDEVLGCGGTIARHVQAGDSVYVVVMADGVRSRGETDAAVYARERQFVSAMASLGVSLLPTPIVPPDLVPTEFANAHLDGWCFMRLQDQMLDKHSVLELSTLVAGKVSAIAPDVIYTHWPHDLNADHRAVANAVLTVTRPAVSRVLAVYGFETPSSTEWAFGFQPFAPTRFVDISPWMDRKVHAFLRYETEVREQHPRSRVGIHALATWRGQTIGVEYAEAFAVLREVVL